MVSYALCPAMGLMVVSVMAVALAVGRQQWQPQQLPRNQVYRLFRMLLPNPLAGQIPGARTHFKCQPHALLYCHPPWKSGAALFLPWGISRVATGRMLAFLV